MRSAGVLLLNTLRWAALVLWTALWIVLALLLMVVTLRRDLPLVMARRIWAPFILRVAGAHVEIEGAAIDWSRPHVFVMNHQSALDIPVAFLALRSNLRFIAKKELARVPFLGWYMLATGMIFVDRGSRASALRTIEAAGRRIREGTSILAFPEGTRSRDGYLRRFKKGVFVVALEAGVPIVPVAVEGSRNVLPSDTLALRRGRIRLRIEEPIETLPYRELGRDALIERVESRIAEANLELGGLGSAEPAVEPAG